MKRYLHPYRKSAYLLISWYGFFFFSLTLTVPIQQLYAGHTNHLTVKYLESTASPLTTTLNTTPFLFEVDSLEMPQVDSLEIPDNSLAHTRSLTPSLSWLHPAQEVMAASLQDNQLQIYNPNEDPLHYHIAFSIPKHWTLISEAAHESITIPPKATIAVPFRLFVPQEAVLGKTYTLTAHSQHNQSSSIQSFTLPITVTQSFQPLGNNPTVKATFLPKQMSTTRNSLISMQLQLANLSDSLLLIEPIIEAPEYWTLIYTPSIPDTLLPKDTLVVPVQIHIPASTKGGKHYPITAKILNHIGEKNMLADVATSVYIHAKTYRNTLSNTTSNSVTKNAADQSIKTNSSNKTKLTKKQKAKQEGTQESVHRGLAMAFVKPVSVHDPNLDLYFNSIRIRNVSKDSISFKPSIKLPRQWTLANFLPIPKQMTLGPKEVAFIPIKINIPSTTKANHRYRVQAHLYDLNKEKYLLNKCATQIKVAEKSDWEIELINEDLLLPKNSKDVSFAARLKNMGNKPEEVVLAFTLNGKIVQKSILMPPGFDSTFVFNTPYQPKPYISTRGAISEHLIIRANNGDTIQNKKIEIIKLDNKYDGGYLKEYPHSVYLRTTNLLNRPMNVSLAAQGIFKFEDTKYLSYNLTQNRLFSNREQFINNLRYQMGYYSPTFDAILGSVPSVGQNFHGVNLIQSNRTTNNLFGLNTAGAYFKTTPGIGQHVTFSLVQNLRDPITSLGIEYRTQLGNSGGHLYSGLFYGLNFEEVGNKKRSGTSIATFQTNLPINNKHYLNLLVNASHEKNLYTSTVDSTEQFIPEQGNQITTIGYYYNLQYHGRFSPYFSASAGHTYASPKYSGLIKGILSANAFLRYNLLGNTRYSIILGHRFTQRLKETYLHGLPQQHTGFQRYQWSVQYQMRLTRRLSLLTLGSLNQYKAERRTNLTPQYLPFQNQLYTVGLGKQWRINSINWFTIINYNWQSIADHASVTDSTAFTAIPTLTGWDMNSVLRKRGWSAGAAFKTGTNNLLTTYQSNQNRFNRSLIRFFGNYSKRFPKQNMQLNVSSQYSHSFGNNINSSQASISSTLYAFFPNRWTLELFNSFQYSFTDKSLTPQLELGLRKDFSLVRKKRDRLENVEVICFKDINRNGRRDEFEPGIPDIQVNLKPEPKSKKQKKYEEMLGIDGSREKRLPPVSLYSNEDGKTTFKDIPAGAYSLGVQRIYNNLDGFFNQQDSDQQIVLNRHQVYEIPFTKSHMIYGRVRLDKDRFTKAHSTHVGNIRVTAENVKGEQYSVLTDMEGNFSIPVPEDAQYTVTITDPLSSKKIQLMDNNIKVHFQANSEAEVEFIYKEKERKINFN